MNTTMQVTAHLHNLRISPRKVRLVTGVLKGLDATEALHQLRYLTKRSSQPVVKLLNSALANASHNRGLVKENMYVKDISVDGGRVLKRFRPKGFGMTSPIAKRTSHITITLDEKVPGLKADVRQEQKNAEAPTSKTSSEEKVAKPTQGEVPQKKGMGGQVRSLGRKFFRRKSM